jgi:hypothetical protein
VIKNISPGIYDLKISDRNNCSVVIKNFINIPAAADCDNVITPNGDGKNDSYYVGNTGTIQVLSKEGRVIKELPVPGPWDGTDNTGEVVPMGLYIILINGTRKVGVVVVN